MLIVISKLLNCFHRQKGQKLVYIKQTIKLDKYSNGNFIANLIFFAVLLGLGLYLLNHSFKSSDFYKVLVVKSGSMTPAIGVGSLIFVLPQNSVISPFMTEIPKYFSQDVVLFKNTESDFLITHRIINWYQKNGSVFYKTKGDANNTPDQNLVSQNNILGKVMFSVPYIGYVVDFARMPYGYFLMIVIPCMYIIFSQIMVLLSEFDRKKINISFSGNYAMPMLLFLVAGFYFSGNSFSFFSSSAQSNNNIFTASNNFPQPTPSIAQTLVMNEILPVSSCNSGQTNGQFVELWNGSGGSVDLQNYKLSDGTNIIAVANSNTTLANGAYAILVKSEGIVNQCLGGNVNGAVTVNLGGNIDLNTGLLKLIDTDGITVLDRVEFGASNSGVLQTIPDQSIERNLLGLDSALGDTFAVSDFGKQCPITPGTWTAPTDTCSVVINELMWMGNSTSTVDEWIELRNTTSNPINLTGWVIKGASSTGGGNLTISSGTIPANGYFLISNYAETDGNSTLNITPDLVTTNVELNNSNKQYVLVNNLGYTVDVADDGSGAPLAGSNGTPKASMERNSTPGDGTLGANWHTATTSLNFDASTTELGTPKAVND